MSSTTFCCSPIPSPRSVSRSAGTSCPEGKASSAWGARKKRGRSECRSAPSPKPSTASSSGVDQLRIGRLTGVRECARLGFERRQVDRLAGLAHLGVAAVAEGRGVCVLALDQLAVETVQLVLDRPQPLLLDLGTYRGVGLVGLDHRRLPESELPSVNVDGQRGLAAGQLGIELLCPLADEALDGEVEQHRQPPPLLAPRRRRVEPLVQSVHRLAREQLGVAAIDRLERILVVQARVVPVVGVRQFGGKPSAEPR